MCVEDSERGQRGKRLFYLSTPLSPRGDGNPTLSSVLLRHTRDSFPHSFCPLPLYGIYGWVVLFCCRRRSGAPVKPLLSTQSVQEACSSSANFETHLFHYVVVRWCVVVTIGCIYCVDMTGSITLAMESIPVGSFQTWRCVCRLFFRLFL